MDEVELIAQAIEQVGFRPPEGLRVAPDYDARERLLIGAMEAFYGAGGADEQAGTVDTTGHVFRVDRFTLETDSAGTVDFTAFKNLEDAERFVAAVAEGEAIAGDLG